MSDLSGQVKVLSGLLRDRSLVMTSAESCTGGLISKSMTDFSGSSDIFWGGFVTYSNESKTALLGVGEEVLEKYGAVSEETVTAMAEGALRLSGAGCSVSVSGIAGPGGGSGEKPVGTVWIGVSLKGVKTLAKLFLFKGNREEIRYSAALEGIRLLSETISAFRY